MKAIVTGGAGFIGSHLVDLLLEEEWDVLVVDDGTTADSTYINSVMDKIAFIGNCVQHVHHPARADVIFHLAGKVGPVGVLKFAGTIAQDTIDAASKAGEWAQSYGCPLVFVSTSEVYGSPDALNSEDTPKVFRGPPSARQEYAAGKLAAEIMLGNREDIDLRIVRPFNVTGPRQSTRGGFVLPRFVQQAMRGEDLTVYAPGTQKRSFTHVKDIVEGMMRVYECGMPGEIYNLGNANNTSTILELANEVIDVVGHGQVRIVDPVAIHGPKFKEAPDKIPNAQKAADHLGWYPIYNRRQIIEEVYMWEQYK